MGEKDTRPLRDKVVIVTGGAQGLGKAYVSRLCEEGAKVVIADIQDAREIVQSIDKKGGDALALYTNVTDEESTKEMALKTVEEYGRIDVLINNAAQTSSTGIVRKPFYEISAREWDKVMEVNLKGVFLCCKAVYPQMKKQGKGKIINVSSGTFFRGSPYFIHYVTSKGGVIGFTRALAREVGDNGIYVNAISPGYTLTDALRERSQYPKEFVKAMIDSRCLKREALPEDLTGTIVFLASDDSDFITGQTIVVDGGSVLH
jgi:NAD(P)-dependent dehydrogenase (short-subunit alcohol dehydrogenase family)